MTSDKQLADLDRWATAREEREAFLEAHPEYLARGPAQGHVRPMGRLTQAYISRDRRPLFASTRAASTAVAIALAIASVALAWILADEHLTQVIARAGSTR
jgi:hypothetical protein